MSHRKAEPGTVPAVRPDVAEIYRTHEAGLRGFVSRRVSIKEDVEDILQNVFFSLSRVDLDENPIEYITSWLYSVARNQITDRWRKHTTEPMPTLKGRSDDDDFIADISELLAGESGDPETDFLRSAVWNELEAALAELPAEQRSVFEMTEMEGFSFRDISESTGVAVNTLLSRKRYAVLHLRERLEDIYREILMS